MDITNRLLKVRRRIASFSLGMLVASLLVTGMAQAQTFTDVQPSDWFYNYVEQGVSEGWINSSFSEFRPADLTNRYEAAMVVYKAFGFDANPTTKTTASFNDQGYGPNHWAFIAVETLVENGVISGYNNSEGQPTGFFGGADSVTRIQYAKMVKRGAPLTTLIMDSAPNFPDVPVTHPLYEDWESAYSWSVINGYPDGTGKPDNNIIRAEIAAMTARALSPVLRPGAGFEVEDASAMALNKVEVCFSTEPGDGAEDAANYMIEDNDGNELDVMSVAMSTSDSDCVELTTANQEGGKNYDLTVSDVMSASGEELTGAGAMTSFTGYKGGVVGGPLTCASGTQPQGVSVPKGATGVNFVVVDCTAGDDDVVMSSLTFHRFGAGDESDFDNVYLYADDNRITTGRSINSETQMIEFSGLNYEIPAGETVSFWVAGDISTGADAASQHAFELMNEDAIESNASAVDLNSAVQGNLFTVSGATAGTVTIEENGSLDEVTIGENARIAQFLLSAGGSEAMEFERVALYVRGTCDSDDVADFDLMVEGSNEVLAHADNVGAKDLVSLVLENPYIIPQGDSKVFYVMATNTCRNNETIKTYLDETTDLHVTGVTFGTGVQVINNFDGTGTQFSEVTVKGSDFTVAFNGPDAGDIAIGQDMVSCLDLTITNVAGTDVEIKDWDVTLDLLNTITADQENGLLDADDEANYSLIKLVAMNATGGMTTLLGPSELSTTGDDDSQVVTLAGSKMIKSGESIKAAIVMDVANNTSLNGDKLRCTLTDLTTDGSDYVRDLNGDALGSESITPATNITGNTFTLSSAGLTFAISATPSSRTYVSGANNAELLGLSVTSGSSLSNTVKSITLQGYVDCNTAGTVFSSTGSTTIATHCAGETANTNLKDVVDSLALYNGATPVSVIKNVNADGTVIFNNLNIVVPKSTTVNLKLKGHVNNSAPYGTESDRIAFSIDDETDIVAIDSNGQNVNTGSINVDSAVNTGADTNNDVVMTIASGGSGTIGEQGSASRKIMIGNSAETELAKFKFTSENEDVSLRKITLGTLNRNGASLQYVKLYTGSSCATPVKMLGGTDSGEFSSTGASGLFTIQGLNLTITDAGDTYLCVKGKTPSVSGSGDPVSGDNVGVVLLDIPEVISGNGTNVSEKYIGSSSNTDTLDTAMDADDTTMILGSGNPSEADVVLIDQEQILITNDANNPSYTVVRGFGNTTPAAHAVGETVYISTLTTGATGSDTINANDPGATDTTLDVVNPSYYTVGDVVAVFPDNGSEFEYALVTKTGCTNALCNGAGDFAAGDDIKVVRGMFGTDVLDLNANAYLIFITERGSMFPLRASVPTFTNVAVTGGNVGAGTYTVLKFDVAATGENNVNFNKGVADDYDPTTDNLLSVQLYGSTVAGEIGVCTLRNVTDNEVLDTADLSTVDLTANAPTSIDVQYNFSTKSLVIAPGNKKTLEVQCDLNITGGSGNSVSARMVEADNAAGGDWIGANDADATAYDETAPSVVVYSDGDDTTVDEAGTLIDNLPIFGPSFNSTAT